MISIGILIKKYSILISNNMWIDLLIVIGFLLALLLGFVFIMVSVCYAMGEWHKNRNECRNLYNDQQ